MPFITSDILAALPYRESILVLSAMLVLAIPCALALKGGPGPTCSRVSGTVTDAAIQPDVIPQDDRKLSAPLVDEEETCITQSDETDNGVTSEKLVTSDEGDDSSTLNITDEENHTIWDHINIFTNPTIFIFIINNLLWNAGGAAVTVYAYSYCKMHNFSDVSASLAMTMFGVGSFIGTLFVAISSFLCNSKMKLNRYYLHMSGNIIMGASCVVIPFIIRSEAATVSSLFVLGAMYGMVCSNMGSIIEHLNGPHMLYLVYSYELAAGGIASLVGPSVGARLDEVYGTGTLFYFASATMFAAFILFLVYAFINRSVIIPYSERANKETSSIDEPANQNNNS